MITFLLILIPFIIAFLDSIQETIRVPELFRASKFGKWTGHKWIDPQVSWQNKYNQPIFKLFKWKIYLPGIIWVCFSDLYHTLRFFERLFWILLAICFRHSVIYPSDLMVAIWWWVEYWGVFEIWRGTWKLSLTK